jgi:hypothetical protein
VEWHEGMPTKPYLDNLSDTILILDDLMAESVNDSTLMSIFTERSHHQCISVILIMQNIYHQGKQSISIGINARYLVLFKNPRDRQEIKMLALRMVPDKWRKFLEKFDYETSKLRGKVIIDENRIVKSCELKYFFQDAQKPQVIRHFRTLQKKLNMNRRRIIIHST